MIRFHEFQREFQREQEGAHYLPTASGYECEESCGRLDFGFGASLSCLELYVEKEERNF